VAHNDLVDPVAVPQRLMTSVRALGPAGSRWLAELPTSWPAWPQTGRSLARGWRPVPPGQLPTGAAKAEWLADFVAREWVNLGRPCSQAAADKAVSYAAARAAAFDPERAVLIHEDAHAHNVLPKPGTANDSPSFRLIDPEGLLSEPAHDLGVVLRDGNQELLTGDTAAAAASRCRLAARQARVVDGEAIWQWAFIERLSSGLFLYQLGHREEARSYLAVADRLSGSCY
jgi:streptomycin 6-kinase